MINLHGSRWAPATSRSRQSQQHSNTTAEERAATSRREEFDRFSKLLRRLHWKSQHLLVSQRQVMIHHSSQSTEEVPFSPNPTEAETMFKVDFFEFYVLLERALIHLLAVFGIVVSSAAATTTTADQHPDTSSTIIGDAKTLQRFPHRFHANVLAALDAPSNPLHPILGTGPVRFYVGIAKEFRNRWKDAEERPSSSSSSSTTLHCYHAVLAELKLDDMLSAILAALERARIRAETECDRFGWEGERMEVDGAGAVPVAAPWEAMPDAMDWD